MADYTITQSSVLKTSNTVLETGVAGAAITPGQAVYLDSADNKYKLADADGSGTTTVAGIAMCETDADGQMIVVATGGNISMSTLVKGEIVVLSDNAGGLMPVADLDSGDTRSIVGVGLTTGSLLIKIVNSGVNAS